MRLLLTVEVPSNVEGDMALEKLAEIRSSRQGLTLMTGQRYYIDVDLVEIDLVGFDDLAGAEGGGI